ncbi:MAG TPA: bifunctional diguanylate cyclase/phosphodiesterase [Beijerinckiaceae bacterium]
MTEQEAAQERLWKAANYDDLTGLPNRAFLHAHLRDALASGSPFALLLLDLDDFKDLNDSAGHDAGDAMLRETASRIQDVAGDRAFAARCGGDEFALIVRGGPPEEVRELTRRLLDRLREPLHYAEHKTFSCRASLGLAYAPYDGSDAPALLKAADLALYAAKAAGRNMALSYSPDMGSALQRKVSTAAHVRAALNEGRLIPYYQPKVCLRTGLIKGFEALARIRGGAGRVESAASFSDALAYPDIASDVTEQIMERVVRDASAWTRAGVPFGHVAVNLGEPDFSGLKDIVAEIGAALKRADLPGSALQIEVTENVLLGRGERRTARTLERLKRLGASIAMDDFGTGFGSLSHLRRFPVDVVKIDRSFIKHKDREGAAIAAAIVGLGKSLDLETVAEGVEDKQQFDWLREIGCNAGQGYYFAKPMPGASVPDFIRTWRLPVGLTATSA